MGEEELVVTEYHFKEFFCKKKERKTVSEGEKSGQKKQKNDFRVMCACLYANGSNLVEKEKLKMQERI